MFTTKLPEEFRDCLDDVPYLLEILDNYVGVFLAGGALRTLVSTDEEFSPENTDIDLFFSDRNVANQVMKFFSENNYHKFYECPEGKLTSFVYLENDEPKWHIQCVMVDFYPSVAAVINSFDFTVTQFGTDGDEFVMGDTSQADVLGKELKWHKITYPASSLKRLMKYARKGYYMKEEEYQSFVNKIWEHDWNITDTRLVYVD